MRARETKLSLTQRLPVPVIYLLVLLAGLALYWTTAQPGVDWQDSGFHQWRILTGQYSHPEGLALAHPLLIAMGQPFRIFGTDAPTWLNRLSGIGMAIALANVFLLGLWFTGRTLAALLATAMLAVAHTPWWLATITETYTWQIAFFSTELILLVWLLAEPRWWKLTLLALVSGAGLNLHNLSLLPLPVYITVGLVLTFRRRISAWWIPTAIVAYLAGASLFLAIIIQQGLSSGQWGQTIHSALFGDFQRNVLALSWNSVKWSGVYIALNWPFLSLLPVIVGWWTMPRRLGRMGGMALGAIAAIQLIFAIRYSVPDQFMFLLPSYVMFALGAAVGIDRLLMMSRPKRRSLMALVLASLALTPALYAAAPPIMRHFHFSVRPGARLLPFRDETRYWITPWKNHDNSAQQFAFAALNQVPADAVILADSTSCFPLQITQRLYGIAPEVTLITVLNPLWDHPKELMGVIRPHPTYVVTDQVPYMPSFLAEVGFFRPEGALYRLTYEIPSSIPADVPEASPDRENRQKHASNRPGEKL